MNILQKLFGKNDAEHLKKAGLIDTSRFHSRKPIDRSVAEQLVEIPTLKFIQFHDIKPAAKTLQVLNEIVFKQRKDITLRVYGYPDLWANIEFLRALPELERFDWESVVFGSAAPLYGLTKLVHLGLGFSQPKPKISLAFVADFSESLESLSIDGDYRDTLLTFPKLRKLKSAWFTSTKLDGFDFLKDLPIEILGNYGSRVASFEFVRNLKSIRKLWIKTNTNLQNIDFVEDLPDLEWLELQYVAKMTRFPKCDHLKNLRLIFAFECNRLVDISELTKLHDVKIHVQGKSLKGRHFQTASFDLSDPVYLDKT